jgi:hypothetical protein
LKSTTEYPEEWPLTTVEYRVYYDFF